MFDIGASEMLLCAIIAILVIGPKDLPGALRMAGRWVAKGRNLTRQFRSGFDAMVREAEMEEMERKWAEQNARIMREHADAPPMLPAATPAPSDADKQADPATGEAPATPPSKTAP